MKNENYRRLFKIYEQSVNTNLEDTKMLIKFVRKLNADLTRRYDVQSSFVEFKNDCGANITLPNHIQLEQCRKSDGMPFDICMRLEETKPFDEGGNMARVLLTVPAALRMFKDDKEKIINVSFNGRDWINKTDEIINAFESNLEKEIYNVNEISIKKDR